MSNTSLKDIIEGFIFASDKAISADRLITLFPENEQPEKDDVVAALDELQNDYAERAIELKKVSTGYRFQVKQELTPWVSRLWEEKPARYTRALLETLALIVYRQPITRGEIEDIRGVAVSSNIIKTLQEREWVRVVGHRDVPGRPALYATTKDFLDYFNLESLDQLPPLSEIKDLDTIAKELDPEKNAELIDAINEMKEEETATSESDQTTEASGDTEGAEEDGESVEDIIRQAAELAASVANSTDQFIEQSEAAISGKPLNASEEAENAEASDESQEVAEQAVEESLEEAQDKVTSDSTEELSEESAADEQLLQQEETSEKVAEGVASEEAVNSVQVTASVENTEDEQQATVTNITAPQDDSRDTEYYEEDASLETEKEASPS